MPTHRVFFSSAEMAIRADFTANPHKLVTKAKPVVGMQPYSPLLCEKLHQLLPNGVFNVENSFAFVGTVARAYVRCSHGIKSPVTYLMADLQPAAGLHFTIRSKCLACEGQEAQQPQPQPAVDNAANVPAPVVPLALPQIVPDPLRAQFEGVIQALGVALNTAYANCLASPNPQAFFEEQRGAIVQHCNAVLNQHLMPGEPEVPQEQNAVQQVEQNLIAIAQQDEEREDPPPQPANANAVLMSARAIRGAAKAIANRGRGRGRKP
jgi:hypothetical protein